MKDPTAVHYESEWGAGDEDATTCAACATSWPCKKIKRWRASDSYKVARLVEEVEYLKRANSRQGSKLDALREQVCRSDLVIRGVLIPFVNDLAGGVTDGQATFSIDSDYDDHITLGSLARTRILAGRQWHARYESSSVTVEDGEVTEVRRMRL